MKQENRFINQVFKDSQGNQIKIIKESPLESTLYPESQWNTVHFVHFSPNATINNGRDRSRRRVARGHQNDANNLDDDCESADVLKTINFWDIQF